MPGLRRQRDVQRDEVRLAPAGPRSARRVAALRTRISNPSARLATARPIRPSPMIPSVAPCTSSPRYLAGSHVTQSPSLGGVDRLGQPARRGQQQRERQVRGRVGEHIRRVADRDASPRGRGEVDVVVADRVVGDRSQAAGRRRSALRRCGLSGGSAGRLRPPRAPLVRPAWVGADPPDLDLMLRLEPSERGSGKQSGHEAGSHGYPSSFDDRGR